MSDQEIIEKYFEIVVPQMPNIDHTPAISFIKELLNKKDTDQNLNWKEELKDLWLKRKIPAGYGLVLHDIYEIVENELHQAKEEGIEEGKKIERFGSVENADNAFKV